MQQEKPKWAKKRNARETKRPDAIRHRVVLLSRFSFFGGGFVRLFLHGVGYFRQ